MSWLVVSVASVAWVISVVRWLRVAQREHYIAGSCITIARLWVRSRPPNAVLAGLATVAAVGGLFGLWPLSILSSIIAGAFPFGMSVLGADGARLNVTRRVRTLAAVVVILSLGLGAVLFLAGGPAALAIVTIVVLLLTDAAAFFVAPLERRLADRHRQRAENKLRSIAPSVVAITGSFGKTSTKNHLRALIGDSYVATASPASWNNTAGLSRAINEHLNPGSEVFIAEMGTYGPGEIRDMCSWVHPQISVITAIGPAHLERMGSLENILVAKSEILEGAEIAVLNVGDSRLASLAATATTPVVVRCAETASTDIDVALVPTEGGGHAVWIRGQQLGEVLLPTSVHASNVACAIGAAVALGVDPAAIHRRLLTLTSPEHRATVGTSTSGVLVIDDTFNSNPSGAMAALRQLHGLGAGRTAVVTPGMVELGATQEEENEAFAREISRAGSTLVVVGWTNRRALIRGADASPMEAVPDRAAAREWVRSNLGEGDAVLWENDLPDHYP
jgi:UDP-N-acetylmuramoyl-tripeptide--D-alanyl-D-alanine ligase